MADEYLSPEDRAYIRDRRLREGEGGSELSGFEVGQEVQDIEEPNTSLTDQEAGYDQAEYDESEDSAEFVPQAQAKRQSSRSPASTGEVSDIEEQPAAQLGQEVADIEESAPAASGMSTPQIARDDVGLEVKAEMEKKLHGVLSLLEPFTAVSHYSAEGLMRLIDPKRNFDNSTKYRKSKYYGYEYPETTFVDVASYSGDSLLGTDEQIIEDTLKRGGTAHDAAVKTGIKAAGVYTAAALAEVFGDLTNYVGLGGISKAEKAMLREGLDAGRTGSLVSIKSPIRGETWGEITKQEAKDFARPATELAGKVGDKLYEISPEIVQDNIRRTRNAYSEAVDYARKFSPMTGDVEIDAVKKHTLATNQMIPEAASKQFLDTRYKRGITDEESAISTVVSEKTPNLMPSIKGIEPAEFKQPIETYKPGESQTLFHGTPRKYDQYDFEKTGGIKFFAEEPGRAYPYATTNGGSNRQRGMKDSDFFTIDHSQTNSHGVVYEFDSDKGIWKATAIASDGSLPNSFKPIPSGEKYPNKTMDDFRDLYEEENWQVEQVSKYAKVEEQKFSGLNVLNTYDDDKALQIISNLKPKTQIGKELVAAAKRDLESGYGQRRGGDFGFHFWTRTKSSPKETMRQIREDIVGPLQEMGYDGLRFMDDSHPSVAVFEPKPKKGLTANGRRLSTEEERVLGFKEDELRFIVGKSVSEVLEKEGKQLPPQRIEAIVDDVMDIKKMGALMVQARQASGKLDLARPLQDQLIENFVAHIPDVRVARALSRSRALTVEEVLEWTAADARREIEGLKVNTNPDKNFRREFSRDLTIGEANLKMMKNKEYQDILKKAGTNEFFVKDAYTANWIRMVQEIKAANSKPMMDMLEKRGFKWIPRGEHGAGRFVPDPKVYPMADRLGPPAAYAKRLWADSTASKLTYSVARKEVNISRMLDMYNWVFRTTALAKPGYYLQNWGDALYKNMTQFVLPADYVDAMKAWRGKGTTLLDGRIQPSSRLMDEMRGLGIDKTSHAAEVLYSAMAMGKRLTAEGIPTMKKGMTFKDLKNNIARWGSSGENWSRAALYINRRKQGYSPRQALYDVENIHFNYGETTRELDIARKLFPFLQFPVKSIGIAKNLVADRPGLTSLFVKGQEMADRALNDPTESAFLQRINPGYKQIQNGIYVGNADKAFQNYNQFIDDMLGANSWVARNVLSARYSEEAVSALSRYGVKVKLPVGPDALTPWMIWDEAVRKNGGIMSGPLGNALGTLLTGRDSFTGEDYGKHGWANQLGASMYQLAVGPIATPAIAQAYKQAINPPDDRFFSPPALLWVKGMLGGQSGFVEVDNLDRMYLFKKSRLKAEYDQLARDFNQIHKREVINGNKNLSWLSGVPGTTAREVLGERASKMVDMKATMSGGDYAEWKAEPINPRTKKPYPVPDLAEAYADMKGLLQANREMDKNYVTMKELMVKSRREEREEMAKAFRVPEPEDAPEEEVSDDDFDSVDVPGNDQEQDETEETE